MTEDRYVKWVQIIPTAHCCVHHSHVYVEPPEGANTRGPRARPGLEHRRRDRSDRVRRRQRRRHLRRRHGEDDSGRIDVPLLVALPSVRRGGLRPAEGRDQVLPERLQAEVRRHVTPHPHRRRPRLDLQPRARRGPDPARRREDRHRRARDADRRAGRREPAAQRGVPEHSAEHRRAPRSLLAAAKGGADHQLPAAHALPRQPDGPRGDSS